MRTLLKLVLYGSLLVAPILAVSLWLDAHGETVTGTVTAKREEIHAENEPTGGWHSRRFLEVDIPRLAAVGFLGGLVAALYPVAGWPRSGPGTGESRSSGQAVAHGDEFRGLRGNVIGHTLGRRERRGLAHWYCFLSWAVRWCRQREAVSGTAGARPGTGSTYAPGR